MNITRALTIEGWMEGHDLEWLAQQASSHHLIVEVGCWKGRSTTVLADNTDGVVYAVDTWLGSEEHNPPVQGLYEAFCTNMQTYIDSGKVVPTRMDSISATAYLKSYTNQTFDMIFIDAAHDYESIKADIIAWKPLVRSGGLFCGHDAGHPPIMQATQELLPGVHHEHSMWIINL